MNGQYGDFSSDPITNTGWAEGEFLGPNDFVSAVKCDINGDGRDSALALVYTYFNSDRPNDTDRNIYMLLYDPVSGTHSEPFVHEHFSRFEELEEVSDKMRMAKAGKVRWCT